VLHEGSIPLLNELRKRNLSSGVLSSVARALIDIDIATIEQGQPDFRSRFVKIQTQEDTEKHKPDPTVFNPMFAKLSGYGEHRPEEVLYVGDHETDYLAASGAGMAFVGVTTGLYDRGAWLDLGLTNKFMVQDQFTP